MADKPFYLPDSLRAKYIAPAASGRLPCKKAKKAKAQTEEQRPNALLHLENPVFAGAIKEFKRFYNIADSARLNAEQLVRLEYMILTGRIIVEEKRLAFLK